MKQKTALGTTNPGDGLGVRLRAIREKKKISVRELGRRASVSASLISQVELGRVMPSVSTLYSIAHILDLSVDELFKDAVPESTGETADEARRIAGSPIQSSRSRQVIKLASGVAWERLTSKPDEELEFLYVVYDVGGASCAEDAMIRHGGKEYGYVVSGRLGVKIGFVDYEVAAGDSFSFDGQTPHRIWAIGKEPAVAIWAVLNRHKDER